MEIKLILGFFSNVRCWIKKRIIQVSCYSQNLILTILLAAMFGSFSCEGENPVTIEDAQQSKLVFRMDDSEIGPRGIYTMNLDGSNLKPIAVIGDSVYFPGKWGDYYVFEPPFAPLSNPRWSPDGKKIACQLTFGYLLNSIMIMNANGSNKLVLIDAGPSATKPIWSPEGDKILFQKFGDWVSYETVIVDTSGANMRPLRFKAQNPQFFEGDSVWIWGNYQWGSTGNILYCLGSVGTIYNVDSNPSYEIFSIDSQTGSVINRLTYNDIDEEGFQVSPKGKYVAFKRGDYNKSNHEFNTLSLEDGNITTIKLQAEIDTWHWSNNGSKIIYERSNIGHTEKYPYMVDINKPTEFIRLSDFKASTPDIFIPEY